MCGRRSMGYVYYMWQLVFTDIINNKLFIIYCKLTCDHLWYWFHDRHYYVHAMIDTWLYSRPDCTYGSGIDCHFCSLMLCRPFLICYIFLWYSHHMLTCYMPLHLLLILHTHWEFLTPWIWTPRSMYVILLIVYLERITRVTKNQSSLTRSSFLDILLLLFIRIVFMILCIALIAYSIPLFIFWHVCIFICIAAVILIHHSDHIAIRLL